jgi:hypothetical protein
VVRGAAVPRAWSAFVACDAFGVPDIHESIPHPHIARRKASGPPKVADAASPPPTASPAARFNAAVAVKITDGVGTMWCAYAFAALALVSLPDAIGSKNVVTLVSWISQTFLQLVLLSIIIVGQNIQATASDQRAEATYEDADAVLHTALDIQHHLQAQDAEIERILAEVRQLRPS